MNINKEPYRIWDLFWTPPNGPFFCQKNKKNKSNCRKLNSTSDRKNHNYMLIAMYN